MHAHTCIRTHAYAYLHMQQVGHQPVVERTCTLATDLAYHCTVCVDGCRLAWTCLLLEGAAGETRWHACLHMHACICTHARMGASLRARPVDEASNTCACARYASRVWLCLLGRIHRSIASVQARGMRRPGAATETLDLIPKIKFPDRTRAALVPLDAHNLCGSNFA